MDPRGHIYEGSKEKPVKPEDAARLDGYLKGRAEADAKKRDAEMEAKLWTKHPNSWPGCPECKRRRGHRPGCIARKLNFDAFRVPRG
jgi:hypothetical protein